MKLAAKLALSQIRTNRNRSLMTLLGIVLSSAMLTAVCGYVESARITIYNAMGFDPDAPIHFAVVLMGAVLGAIIVTASVIVVSNAFRVSAGERTRQFGILKSVGATKRQIAASVLYEGVFLSAVGIPLGILAGLGLDWLGVTVLSNLLRSLSAGGTLHVDSEAYLTVPFAAPPLMLAVAAVSSFGTVLLSAWLPARKAAKIPAIDAIRSSGEVKLKSKQVRTSRLTQAVFGFEGTLAAKSLKRSRRSFRATVVSLTISIVLLIAAGSFGTMMKGATNLVFANVDAQAMVDWSSDQINLFDDEGGVVGVDYIPLGTTTAEMITGKLRDYGDVDVYGIGRIRRYPALPDGTGATGMLMTVDEAHYRELCRVAGVPEGSNILLNMRREAAEGKRKEYAPYHFADFKGQVLSFTLPGHEPVEVTIHGQLTGADVPNELAFMYDTELAVLVPSCDAAGYIWLTKTGDAAGFIAYADEVMTEAAPKSERGIPIYNECLDIASASKQLDDLVNTIMFFVYGFVGMLTLIAVTSVISTIGTNIRSRAKEFAALESVGMTGQGIRRMLNLESILCSVRSLVFGLPLGVLGAYGLHHGLRVSVELPFAFPWLLVGECVLGVFIVTWVTMRYAASRLANRNLVETIRGE